MNDLIIEVIAWGGYWGIAFLMMLENVIPPIPSEFIMGIGGVLMARGVMEFWPLLLAGTVGSTAGNYVWFWAGDKWGYRRLRPMIDRHGRWLTLDWQHIEEATRFFQRYGQWVVFFLRFSPFLRTMISLPAGLAHMSHWRFLVFTFAGAAIWNVVLIFAGSLLAGFIDKYEGLMGWLILAGVLLTLVGYLWRVFTWKPRSQPEAENT